MNDSMSRSSTTLSIIPTIPDRLSASRLWNSKYTLAALAIFTLGFTLDTYTTTVLITQFGFVESNPVVALVFNHGGIFGVLWYKTMLVVMSIRVVIWTNFLQAKPATNICFACVGTLWFLAGLQNLRYLI